MKPFRVLTTVLRDLSTDFSGEFGEDVAIYGFTKSYCVIASSPQEAEKKAKRIAQKYARRFKLAVDRIECEEIAYASWIGFVRTLTNRGVTFFSDDP